MGSLVCFPGFGLTADYADSEKSIEKGKDEYGSIL
jgi:hypothetical protein